MHLKFVLCIESEKAHKVYTWKERERETRPMVFFMYKYVFIYNAEKKVLVNFIFILNRQKFTFYTINSCMVHVRYCVLPLLFETKKN